MSLRIQKGQTTFLRGIDSLNNLHEFFDKFNKLKNPIGVAFLGRSNVGKSTLINSLFGKNVARTSKTPGRTREINVFNFSVGKENLPPLFLFDLPGYGFAAVSKKQKELWNTMIGEFFSMLPQQMLMISIQDARHPNQKADEEFKDFLQDFDFEVAIVFNKIDKLKTQKERSALQKTKDLFTKENPWVNEIFTLSAEKGTGLDNLQKCISNFIQNQK